MTTPVQSAVQPALTALYKAEYINVTTLRKNGAPVPTPLWFAEHAGILYVETAAHSGKVKRLRHTPRVVMATSTASGRITGETFRGEGRIITDVAEIYVAKGALHRKYGWKRQLYYAVMEIVRMLRRQPDEPDAFLAFTPII